MSTTELIFNNTKFYPMNENTDGSISFNGQTYEIGNQGSDVFDFYSHPEATKGKYDFFIASSTKLISDSTPTINDLINKGEKIRLVIVGENYDDKNEINYIAILVSQTIDLSKPDSNGHFNFSWADGDTSVYAYCWLSNGNFLVTSDSLNEYANYQFLYLQIYYSDAS